MGKSIVVKLLIVSLFGTVVSCRVYFPDRMMHIDPKKLTPSENVRVSQEYVIQPGDLLAIGVFSNNGYELVDVLQRGSSFQSSLRYMVRPSGYVNLPMLDTVLVAGLTINDAEHILAEKYSYFFVNPFIRIEVSNRNVLVFRGREGAQVVLLQRDDMHLLEVLAMAGGMPIGGKAHRVRIIRGNLQAPTVFDVDLSSVEAMQRAPLIMQAGDVVYIESRITTGDILNRFVPIISFVTTLLLLYTYVVAVGQ